MASQIESLGSKQDSQPQLDKTLGPVMLWGLGVGYVISGMYFGWNLGLKEGGTYGLAIATAFIVIMYSTFTLSYAELACAIPRAGGAFDYAQRALGPRYGYFAGVAQIVEFVFAPPAIAAAIGAYLHIFMPSIPKTGIALAAYFVFTAINIYGVRLAALFELFVTILAVFELLLFAGLTLPHFSMEKFSANPMPAGWMGIFASIPFAIWFFLAIEGIANLAEETVEPQKNLVRGFSASMITLVVLCILTFTASIGVDGWESIVFTASGEMSDSPLPLALKVIVGENSAFYHLLVGIGIFGLVASFHGIILASGRATLEFGRAGYAPQWISKIHPTRKTPMNALLANMVVGILALLTGKTGDIIIIACFGAISLYVLAGFSVFALRKKEPRLPRPFLVPVYPVVPAMALSLASVAMLAMIYFYPQQAMIYFTLIAFSFIGFILIRHRKLKTKN